MSEQPSTAAPVALRRSREETIRILCEHFTADHLEAEELEQLIDAAHGATAIAQLDALVADLPELPTAAPDPGEGTRIAPRGAVPEHGGVVAVLGGTERRGSWTPARNTYVVAVMGGVDLDFREALLDPGVTEVYVLALMGGVDIVVPPGLRVDCSGVGIMGGFAHVGDPRYPVDMSAPVLRIRGAGVMGGVDVSVRQRGESAGDARKRLKGQRP